MTGITFLVDVHTPIAPFGMAGWARSSDETVGLDLKALEETAQRPTSLRDRVHRVPRAPCPHLCSKFTEEEGCRSRVRAPPPYLR